MKVVSVTTVHDLTGQENFKLRFHHFIESKQQVVLNAFVDLSDCHILWEIISIQLMDYNVHY